MKQSITHNTSFLQKIIFILFISVIFLGSNLKATDEIQGFKIVKGSFDMWRGTKSSVAKMTMKITRPDRNEQISLQSYAKGDKLSLVRFIGPAKYKGQAVLVNNNSMWTYSAKSKRSIKISSSLRSRSWLGSDMSYDDISLSIDVLEQYNYKLLPETTLNGQKAYVIEATPFKNAPIVWGKEVYYIRKADNALLEKVFYDQAGKAIRKFEAVKIGTYEGKPTMDHMKVTNLEKEGYFTEFIMENVKFNVELEDSMFSLQNLEQG